MTDSLPHNSSTNQKKLARWVEYSRALNLANDQAQILEILLKCCADLLAAEIAGIFRSNGAQQAYFTGLSRNRLPPNIPAPFSDPVFLDLLQLKSIQLLHPADHYDSGSNLWNYFRDQQMQSILVAPLGSGEQSIGFLYLAHSSKSRYAKRDLNLLSAMIELSNQALAHLQSIEQLSRKVADGELELKVLYEMVTIASEAQDSESLLNASLAAALQATNCQIGVIHLMDAGTQRLNIATCRQFSEELHNWLELSGLAQELWGRSYSQSKIVQEHDLRTQSYTELTGAQVFLLNYLGAPIRTKGKTLGVLSIFNEKDNLLSQGNADLVSTIADQIGLALESNRLHRHVEENLILQERQRLARDLHDSISQSLYGLVLAADASRKLLQIQEYDELKKTLVNIDKASRQSLKEMRLMLFELRPLSIETEGLVKALELRLNSVERRAGVEIDLVVKEDKRLPNLLETEIYRIATEALNNSLKHAEAKRVFISFRTKGNQVMLEVVDDGKGFDPSTTTGGGMGLIGMTERASRISGVLKIDSAPGQGTHIRLNAPIQVGCKG